jgi:hypothetical protein
LFIQRSYQDALLQRYPFKKPGEISEVCVEQENALDSNFGNFLPQNIEMILAKSFFTQRRKDAKAQRYFLTQVMKDSVRSRHFSARRQEAPTTNEKFHLI